MFLIHPILQFSAIILSILTLSLGLKRFLFLHLKKKSKFNWKLHVRLGIVSLIMVFMGTFGGIFVAYTNWNGYFITGIHGYVGIILLFFVIFGLTSGLYMDKKKKKRVYLPLIHGICNTIFVLLCIFQIYSGIVVYKTFVLGI